MGVLAIAALATTSCSSTKQLYSWYNYEDIVYHSATGAVCRVWLPVV